MSANKIRNDAWWLLKCYDYLLGPLQMSEAIRLGWQDFRVTLESKMEEHARAMEELENNTKSNHISLEIKEKVQSPALDPSLQTSSRHISEPTAFLDIIQQTPPSHQTPMSHFYSKGFIHPNSSDFVKTSDSVKTNGLSSPVEKPAEKSPAKIPAPIVLVTKEEEEEEEDDLEEEVANVQKGLEKVVLTKSEEAEDEADDEAEEEEEEVDEEEAEDEAEEEEVLTKSEGEEEADEEEEVEENYEMTQIKKVRYWHETNSHKLYKYISEDEVGDLVGKWHNIGGIVTISPV